MWWPRAQRACVLTLDLLLRVVRSLRLLKAQVGSWVIVLTEALVFILKNLRLTKPPLCFPVMARA